MVRKAADQKTTEKWRAAMIAAVLHFLLRMIGFGILGIVLLILLLEFDRKMRR